MTSPRLPVNNVIDTDLPTNDHYITQENVPGELTTDYHFRTSLRRPYDVNLGGFIAVSSIPQGFADSSLRGGVAGLLNSSRANGDQRTRLVLHPPGGSVLSYNRDWKLGKDPLTPFPADWFGYVKQVPTAVMASQRHGNRVYAVINYFGAEYDFTPVMVLARITGLDSVELVTRKANSDLFIPIFTDEAEIFVSDDAKPFVWIYERYGDDALTTGFWDNPEQYEQYEDVELFYDPFLGYRERKEFGDPTIVQSGQTAAYRQVITQPTGYMTSTFVYPWSQGDYHPPLLWHLVQTDPGVYEVYRSQWVWGGWQRIDGYEFRHNDEFDPDKDVFPYLNQQGWGWQSKWHTAAHKVTTITLPGVSLPQVNVRFKFFRDSYRDQLLHFVAAADYQSQNVITDVWSGHSSDDGATWTNVQQIQPAHTVRAVDDHGWRDGDMTTPPFSAVRVPEGNTLVAATDIIRYLDATNSTIGPNAQPLDAGAHAALLAVDPIVTSAADAESKSVYFKRGENRGTVAWL